VNALLKVGLLLPVQTRKRRSRTEDAYVQKAYGHFTPAPPFDPDYTEQMIRGFRAILRHMDRERAALIRLENLDPSMGHFDAFRLRTVRLSPAAASNAKKRLVDVLNEIAEDEDSEGLRVNISVYMAPTLGETQELYSRLAGQELPDDSFSENEG
jgi:hypothetical protein